MVQKDSTSGQILKVLQDIKGAKMVTIVTETEPKMRKTNNPYAENITKRVMQNVVINFDYKKRVNRQLLKEGKQETFTPKPRKWGERIAGTCMIFHNNQVYVEIAPNGRPQSVEYFTIDNHTPVAKSELIQFLQEPNSNAEHQGVEKEIILRDIKVSNIKELKYKGIHHIVK